MSSSGEQTIRWPLMHSTIEKKEMIGNVQYNKKDCKNKMKQYNLSSIVDIRIHPRSSALSFVFEDCLAEIKKKARNWITRWIRNKWILQQKFITESDMRKRETCT